ncbi:MAG: hypothetical protein HN742_21750 [Lentisphaerae bacterium]|jgi:hypothetical protein|nr:hypothetical protein [Lentisphaerota bacterium]MBT4818638.1 hypothetical protein [Lentisphaerota bacterium]MBT5607087.1 hypothetical protein [Lentisphaerota bacterium]MBT7057194.1 hypothetical protein [Lentisphaerota bacterium]MBT7844517.1 hypothetical protein [Lentisphaerota bacterium]
MARGFAPVSRKLALALLVAIVGSGCAKMGRFDVTVSVDEQLRNGSVQVDLVGVNEPGIESWRTHSMNEYWGLSSNMRNSADKVEMKFSPKTEAEQTITRKGAMWDRWSSTGAMHLLILGDLPGVAGDKPGNADPRRLILPLAKKRWRGKSIEVQVERGGIRCLTPMKPEKKK